MKILLIVPSNEMVTGEKSSIYPIGAGYLGTVLENEGHEILIKDYSNKFWKKAETEIIKILSEFSPEIVGISCMVTNRVAAFKTIKLIKEKSDAKIIMGGVHPTLMYEQILNNFPVDFVVLGEGEKTVLELVLAIKNNLGEDRLRMINGIAFKSKNEIIVTKYREKMTNEELDKLPIMKHEFFKEKINRYGKAYIITSRGCPFNCSFCSSSQYWGRYRRQRSSESIIKELRYIKSHFPNIKDIYFCEDEFIVDKKRTIELCKLMIKENILLKWACLGRVTSIDEELIKWMKKAGCYSISFGIESGSQRILDGMNKQVTVEEILNACKITKENGIDLVASLIIGFPGENKESVKETTKLLKEIGNIGAPGMLQVYPGTTVYENCKKIGVLNDDYWLTEGMTPLYTYEHSRLKLLYWSHKMTFLTMGHSEGYWKAIKNEINRLVAILSIKKLKKYFRRYLGIVKKTNSKDGR